MRDLNTKDMLVVCGGSLLTDVANGVAAGTALYEFGDSLCGGYDNCGALAGESLHTFLYPDPFEPPYIPQYEIWNPSSGYIY